MMDRYCTGCHNDKLKTGKLSLTSLNVENVKVNFELWEKVVRKLRTRQMPPSALPRPDDRTYDGVTSFLSDLLDKAAAADPNPGRTDTFRRLNRTEYRNAIRDLLAINVDLSSLLPADESSHSFDNVTVGDLSPALLEKYLSAAHKISRLAVGSPVRSPGGAPRI